MKLGHKLHSINWQSAHIVVEAAIEHALKLNVQVAAAVVDQGGHLVSFLRSEKGPYLSVEIAIDKAYTSASFTVPTSQWEELLPEGSILRQGILNRDRFVAFGGGVPIIVNGECIGAIGVSGASEEQDEACAMAGLDSILSQG